ncbi:MAG TPA: hypothetical protein VMM78_16825 [Thermomicrobiales bacterium]|nr:hypothetical protein [Thermomicrobiales bacterium]
MSLLERTHRVVPISVRDHRLHDGRVVDVAHVGPNVHVTIEPRPRSGGLSGRTSDSAMTIVFHDVTEVEACLPERLFFSALIERVEQFHTPRFEFMNWFQPGDDWDPDLATARLEIVAERFSIEGWS